MPQLDITAYFSEYLWTVLSFFIFYYFLSKFFLPEFARALRFEQINYTLSKDTISSEYKGVFFLFHENLAALMNKEILAKVMVPMQNTSSKKGLDSDFFEKSTESIPQKMVVLPKEFQEIKKSSNTLNPMFLEFFEES